MCYFWIVKKNNIIHLYISLFLIFIGVAYPCDAQEMYFTNISNSLNLPSQECYNVIQDSKGYIWICTENGLVKYSKGHSKLFNKQNGLNENAVYYIAENEAGEIEMLTMDNRYLKIKDDVLYEDKMSVQIKKVIKENASPNTFNITYLLTKKEKDIILNTQQRTFLISKEKGTFIDLTKENKYNSNAYILVELSDNESYFTKVNTNPALNWSVSDSTTQVDVYSGNLKKSIKIKLLGNKNLDWRTRIAHLNGVTFLTIHNVLLCIDKDLNYRRISLPSVITSIYADKKHGLWVGASSYGVYHYPDVNNMSNYEVGLNGLTVSSIVVDNEGGTWCTTTEKGVYYSVNYNIKYFPVINELNKKTKVLKSFNGNLFISYAIDKLVYLKNDSIITVKLPQTGNTDLTDIISFKGKSYIASKSYFGELDKEFGINKIIVDPIKSQKNLTIYQLDTSYANLYLLGTGALYKFDGNEMEMLSPTLLSKARCFKVVNDTIIYIGCNDGLYTLHTIAKTLTKLDNINSAVSKIYSTQKGELYFTTKGQGLYKIKNELPVLIGLNNPDLVLNDIIQDINATIWISSNDGLINLIENDTSYTFTTYKKAHGLISNDIGQLSIYNNDLYLSSPDGVCKFPIANRLLNVTAPKLYLRHIKMNDSIVSLTNTESLVFSYWENSFSFTFDQINYKSGGSECLYYKLVGHSNKFESNTTNTISFENLPPNNYELIVYSKNNDGIKSANPITIKFVIDPPFWQTLWFTLLAISCSLLFIGFVVVVIIRNIKAKEEEKTKINKLISESQLKALQAQMNPHFIFNAINSIQNYILDKNEDDAYNYLTKFSKLVRLVLNHSREKEISLHSEIEVLKLYIEIEQLRFGNNFDYSIILADDINPYDIEIPTMLVQPYVENAIWHGLMNLNNARKGQLTIEFSKETDLLKIIIEDNGIGRKKSNEYKADALHHSIGMQLTEERLNMINLLWNTKSVKVLIHDLYEDSTNAIGTRIELFLPLIDSI